ncbi:MAG: hypothetical protein ACFFE8_15300 [Candidatus Heimdallarchaeota archaeon]
MRIIDKTIDTTTGLRLESGDLLEVHLINHEHGARSVTLKAGGHQLVLKEQEIHQFLEFLNQFLDTVGSEK